jgi:hypothetical protein
MNEDSTVSMREIALAQTNSSFDMDFSFDEQNKYIKKLCYAIARTISSTLLKEDHLCESCLQSISAILLRKKRIFTKPVLVKPLQESIQTSDCGLCAAVVECILANNTADDTVAHETVISGNQEEVVIDIEQSSKEFNSIIIMPSGKTHTIKNSLKTLNDLLGNLDNPFTVEHDLNHTSSDLSMASVMTKLLDCLACHPHCMQVTSKLPELPSRVIEVGLPNSPHNPVLRITEGRCGQYVALSHRWAGSRITRTLQANFQSMCQSIPWDDLTKTMQDAVTVTRFLGIQYLWIDSLCIIQDSPVDWSQQSLKMSRIYRNSIVTISADCAHDHSEGFFTSSFRKRKILCKATESSSWRYFADYKLTSEKHTSALEQRGWILQEELLSPRMLKFCHGEIKWECPTSGSSSFKQALNGIKSTSMDLRSQAYISWHQIVQSYSERMLTHKSDKIMALMGIANYTRAIVKDTFLVGLWKNNLWHDLLWSSTDQHDRLDFNANVVMGVYRWTSTIYMAK